MRMCIYVGFPDSSVGKESVCNAGDPNPIPGSERSPGESIGYPLQYSWAYPCGSAGKESAYNAVYLGSTPGLGRSPGEWKGYPLQYSGLENSMDSRVHEVAKSRTQLSNFHQRLATMWRRQWQPTPAFLPGESQEWESLMACPLGGHTKSDTTEAT